MIHKVAYSSFEDKPIKVTVIDSQGETHHELPPSHDHKGYRTYRTKVFTLDLPEGEIIDIIRTDDDRVIISGIPEEFLREEVT